MPQKKTAGKSTAKTTKKTSAKRTSSTSRTSRRTTKKPKVYIPAYKAIILCCTIITICMGLLLITNLKETDSKVSDSIAERFEEAAPEPAVKASEKPAEKTVEKPAPVKEVIKTPEVSKNTEVKTPVETKKTEENIKPAENKKPAEPVKQKEKYNFPKAKNNAQLIFVFDDGGQNISHLTPFLKLPFPITVAVLPQLAYSKDTAAKTRASGNEVILHQPMQAVNASVNPGPGAIKPEMNESQIKSVLFQNVTEIGPIMGMNNHEGSAITADAEKMAVVLQFCSQEGIYFLDSRTNVETKVPYVARELGYSWYERNIFLDNEKTNENALKELKKGLDLANKNGSVIMIGHIWSADFLPAFLQEVYPELKAQGYTFSTVSKSKAKRN